MSQHQSELASIEARLNEPDMYEDANKAKLKECLQQQLEVKNHLETLELQWLELEEQVQAIEQHGVDANE